MDSFRSTRVTVVPKRTKSKVQPMTKSQLSSDVTSSTLSKSSSSPIGIARGRTGKNVRDKKRNALEMKLIVVIIILLIMLTLAALAVNIYLLVRMTAKTTAAPATNVTLRWNSTGITVAGITGSPGTNVSQLNEPIDIAIQAPETLYVVDYQGHRIQKWTIGESSGITIAGEANGAHGTNATDLYNPTGIYVDSESNFYVSDGNNYRVQFYTNGASVASTVAGTVSVLGSASNELYNPYGLSFDPASKTLYIGDFNNYRVMSYLYGASAGTAVIGRNATGTNAMLSIQPCGIYFDPITNTLIIANLEGNNIIRWAFASSDWTLLAGSATGISGSTSSMLWVPTGLTIDPMGNLYVADTGNQRIQLFLAGQTEGITIAGTTGTAGNDATHFSAPYSVRLDSQLNLYVADKLNHRVQKFLRY